MNTKKKLISNLNKDKNKVRKDILTTLSIFIVTLIVYLLRPHFMLKETDVAMMYMLGILFIANRTNGYVYGIISSIISVLCYNFFFINPLHSFTVYNASFVLTFAIMFIAAIIMSTTTITIRNQALRAEASERRMVILNHFSNRIIKMKNVEEIIEESLHSISEICNEASFFIRTEERKSSIHVNSSLKGTLQESIIMGWITTYRIADEITTSMKKIQINETNYLFCIPVLGQKERFGVLGVVLKATDITTNEHEKLIIAIKAHLSLALERELLALKEQSSKVVMERERLRGNLLRSVSHDLRTPLTGILGSTETLLENEELPKETTKELLHNIASDTRWLIHSIENILNITKVDEGKLELQKSLEVLEEIISAVIVRVAKKEKNHPINISIPDEFIMVPMDGVLIQQVLINLLDNAIKYTPNGTAITLKVSIENKICTFEVSDKGKGISKEDLPFIFDQFYRSSAGDVSGRQGMGLGLAICKSIIQAHGGEIIAKNNSNGGASFVFTIPGGIVRYE